MLCAIQGLADLHLGAPILMAAWTARASAAHRLLAPEFSSLHLEVLAAFEFMQLRRIAFDAGTPGRQAAFELLCGGGAAPSC